MKPSAKLHLMCAVYCTTLAALNWSHSIEYSRAVGPYRETNAPVGLALLLAGSIALVLAVRCLRAAKRRHESGRRVAAGGWIPSKSVLLYALPLLFSHTTTSTWVAADGTRAVANGGFGHALSPWVFLVAVAGMILFQLHAKLATDGAPTAAATRPEAA